jgi:hypothetical protein
VKFYFPGFSVKAGCFPVANLLSVFDTEEWDLSLRVGVLQGDWVGGVVLATKVTSPSFIGSRSICHHRHRVTSSWKGFGRCVPCLAFGNSFLPVLFILSPSPSFHIAGVIMPSTPPLRSTAQLPSTPPTPPLPSTTEDPHTPPTSPQRHQQAARDQERSQRHIGSPEQRRTPAIPPQPSALPPVIVGGRELNHLPLDMRMRMINVPPHRPLQRRGHAPPPPFPLPPPFPPQPLRLPPPPPSAPVASGSAIGSSSMASALGPPFIPTNLPFPLPPIIPTPPPRETLNSAQLRELYVPPPIPTRSRGRPSVSYISLLFLLTLLILIINQIIPSSVPTLAPAPALIPAPAPAPASVSIRPSISVFRLPTLPPPQPISRVRSNVSLFLIIIH